MTRSAVPHRAALLLAMVLVAPVQAQTDCNALTAAACTRGAGEGAVAATVGITPAGGSACSGVLLARTSASTGEMGILTADHCVPGDLAVGATVGVTLYFRALGGCVENARLQVIGEVAQPRLDTTATLRMRDPFAGGNGTDSALLVVSDPAPPGAFYAGWDARPLAGGAPVEALGHGRGQQLTLAAGPVGSAPRAGANYFQVAPTRGLILFGHSGSPVFDSAGRVVGGMSDARCTADDRRFVAGRFEKLLPLLRAYLDPAGTGTTLMDGYFAAGTPGGGSGSSGASSSGTSSSGTAGSSGGAASSGGSGSGSSSAATAASGGGGGAFGFAAWAGFLAAVGLRHVRRKVMRPGAARPVGAARGGEAPR